MLVDEMACSGVFGSEVDWLTCGCNRRVKNRRRKHIFVANACFVTLLTGTQCVGAAQFRIYKWRLPDGGHRRFQTRYLSGVLEEGKGRRLNTFRLSRKGRKHIRPLIIHCMPPGTLVNGTQIYLQVLSPRGVRPMTENSFWIVIMTVCVTSWVPGFPHCSCSRSLFFGRDFELF